MTSLKHLRLRIKSIKSTQKITKAMQMVSASKLRHAKTAMDNSLLYHNLIAHSLHSITSHAQEDLSPLAKMVISGHSPNRILAIVITSERGLCGSFNQNILKKARADIDLARKNGAEVKIITIGKKGRGWIVSKYKTTDIVGHYAFPHTKTADQDLVKIYQEILHQVTADNQFDGLRIYFNHFNSAISQTPQARIVIPKSPDYHNDNNLAAYSEYEGYNLLDDVIKMYIESEFYHAMLESRASEEAARMIAMDNATKNAGDMIQQLTLLLNRTRQAVITKELIEIISGAEAV